MGLRPIIKFDTHSKGTKHMVNYVLKQSVHCPVILVWGDPSQGQWLELTLSSLESYTWETRAVG